MAKQLKEFEIPFGAKDSELCGWEYTIPEGMEATIVDNKIVVKKKESEDEKVRKALKEYFINSFQNNGVAAILGVHIKDILIWLEKQGEKNLVNTDLDELVIQLEETIGTSPHSRETIKDFFQRAVQKYMNCLKIANGEIGILVEENYRLKEKQGEQKPVNINYISGIREELLDIENNAENIDGLTESQWVAIRAAHRLLGECITKEQKPAWSEEDEKTIDEAVECLGNYAEYVQGGFSKQHVLDLVSRVESLKDRYSWKPTDAQIASLTIACDRNDRIGFDLTQLLRDLKKLK